jgi:putative redox protein
VPGSVSVRSIGGRYTTRIDSSHHTIVADEPPPAGDDAGPSPYELLLSALGACTSMTLLMYARRQGWPLDVVHIELTHEREHASDGEDWEGEGGLIDVIHRSIRLEGELTSDQRERLAEIARRCPVHKTITSPLVIVDDVE